MFGDNFYGAGDCLISMPRLLLVSIGLQSDSYGASFSFFYYYPLNFLSVRIVLF